MATEGGGGGGGGVEGGFFSSLFSLPFSLSLFHRSLSLPSFSLFLSLDIHITSPENEDGGNRSNEVRKTKRKLGDSVAKC